MLSVKRMENGRDNKGRFVKGNPGGGRKPIPTDVKEAFSGLVPDAVDTLRDLLYSEDERLRLDAAKVILDRVYGKPHQSQDIKVGSSNVMKFEDFFKS